MSVSVCVCVFACPRGMFLLHTVFEVLKLLSTVTHFYQFNAGNIPAEIFM